MFLQRSRGVFILCLFWRSGLRPRGFLRKQAFWKSAVHQLLLNHLVGSRAGAAGPEWCSTLSRVQRPVCAWPGHGRQPGKEGRVFGKAGPPSTHRALFCPSTRVGNCGGGERAAFLSQCAKEIPPGTLLAGNSPGAGVRQTVWEPGAAQGSLWTGVSLPIFLRPPAWSLSSCVYQCGFMRLF